MVRWARRATLVIWGEPPVKKNGKRIIRIGGRLAMAPGREYYAWRDGRKGIGKARRGRREGAYDQLVRQWADQPRLGGPEEPVWLRFRFYVAAHADLSNLYEAPQDVMQEAGILRNDYWVQSHDGSRRIRETDPSQQRTVVDVFTRVA